MRANSNNNNGTDLISAESVKRAKKRECKTIVVKVVVKLNLVSVIEELQHRRSEDATVGPLAMNYSGK